MARECAKHAAHAVLARMHRPHTDGPGTLMIKTVASTPFDAHRLGGRIVIITGGVQGNGRGVAQAACGTSGNVFIVDRSADAGKA